MLAVLCCFRCYPTRSGLIVLSGYLGFASASSRRYSRMLRGAAVWRNGDSICWRWAALVHSSRRKPQERMRHPPTNGHVLRKRRTLIRTGGSDDMRLSQIWIAMMQRSSANVAQFDSKEIPVQWENHLELMEGTDHESEVKIQCKIYPTSKKWWYNGRKQWIPTTVCRQPLKQLQLYHFRSP
jgi:hypothetical protein